MRVEHGLLGGSGEPEHGLGGVALLGRQQAARGLHVDQRRLGLPQCCRGRRRACSLSSASFLVARGQRRLVLNQFALVLDQDALFGFLQPEVGGQSRHADDDRHHQGRNRLVPSRPAPRGFHGGLPPGLDRFVVQEVLQVGRHRLGGLVAPGRIGVDRLVDDGLQIPRHAPPQFAQANGLRGHRLLDQFVAVAFIECRPQGQHLVEGQSKRVDVAAGVGLALERLRRHITQGAEDVPGVGQVLGPVGLGQAEVGHPHRPGLIEQQVRGLHVPVNDPLTVGVLQGLGDLEADAGDPLPVVEPPRFAAGISTTTPKERGTRRVVGGDSRGVGRLVG